MLPKYVEVARLWSIEEAYILKNRLDDEGIDVRLSNEEATNILGGIAMGGVRLYVEERDVPLARAILDEIDQERQQSVQLSAAINESYGSDHETDFDLEELDYRVKSLGDPSASSYVWEVLALIAGLLILVYIGFRILRMFVR